MDNTAPTKTNQIACLYCGKFLLNSKGLKIHISRSHPLQYRANLVNKQNQQNKQNSRLETSVDDNQVSSQTELTEYTNHFCQWMQKILDKLETPEFDTIVEEFLSFLASAIDVLPGPRHPARRYYHLRKKKSATNNQRTYQTSSNPERATKRDREKRKATYNYQLAQFHFYNQRRKAIRQVLLSVL